MAIWLYGFQHVLHVSFPFIITMCSFSTLPPPHISSEIKAKRDTDGSEEKAARQEESRVHVGDPG